MKKGEGCIMNVALCNDENMVLDQLEEYLLNMEKVFHIGMKIQRFQDEEAFLGEDIKKYGLVFLTVEKEKKNGFEIAAKIRGKNQAAEIVFISSVSSYAVHGYRYRAYCFLIKPISYEKFEYEMKELIIRMRDESKMDNYLDIEIGADDILYIEAYNHNVIYHCQNKNKVMRGKMSELEIKLLEYNFIRVQKSYIVSLNKVKHVYNNYLIMEDGFKINIGRKWKKIFRERYQIYTRRIK